LKKIIEYFKIKCASVLFVGVIFIDCLKVN